MRKPKNCATGAITLMVQNASRVSAHTKFAYKEILNKRLNMFFKKLSKMFLNLRTFSTYFSENKIDEKI